MKLDWLVVEGNESSIITRSETGEELFEYTIDFETGMMAIEMIHPEDLNYFYIAFTVNLSNQNKPGASAEVSSPSVEKTGDIEIENNKVNWTVTTVVPRYANTVNNGKAYIWSLCDEVQTGNNGNYGVVINDMTDVKVKMFSKEYESGIDVPSLDDALEEDLFAYYILILRKRSSF